MEVLELKLKSNANNDELEIVEYFVSDSIKQKYKSGKSDNVMEIKTKLNGIAISNVSDSFVIKYARYISCQHVESSKTLLDVTDGSTGSIKTNLLETSISKTGTMPKSLDLVMKKLVLCVIDLNFYELGEGKNVSFDDSIFFIPIEFVYGKKDLNNFFKFYIEYRDNTQPENNEYVTISFQILE